MREQTDVLQSQLPIKVDYSTLLLGTTALYSSSICLITYKYLIESEKYVHFLSSQNGLAESDNASFITTAEGKAAIRKQLADTGALARAKELKELAKHPGIKLVYRHEFDDPEVGIFTTIVVDTTR